MRSSTQIHTDTIKPRLLIAEDDPDQSDLLREIFESDGFTVDAAFSGDIALRWLAEKSYAVAIVDVRMPGLNGGTVLKVCHDKSPPIFTPIIMVSAFASEKDLEQFRVDGAAAFVSKPYDIDELLKKVRDLAHARV